MIIGSMSSFNSLIIIFMILSSFYTLKVKTNKDAPLPFFKESNQSRNNSIHQTQNTDMKNNDTNLNELIQFLSSYNFSGKLTHEIIKEITGYGLKLFSNNEVQVADGILSYIFKKMIQRGSNLIKHVVEHSRETISAIANFVNTWPNMINYDMITTWLENLGQTMINSAVN